MMKKIVVRDEVRNLLTGERFTYRGTENRLGERVVLLESEGHTSRVDLTTFRESFSA